MRHVGSILRIGAGLSAPMYDHRHQVWDLPHLVTIVESSHFGIVVFSSAQVEVRLR